MATVCDVVLTFGAVIFQITFVHFLRYLVGRWWNVQKVKVDSEQLLFL